MKQVGIIIRRERRNRGLTLKQLAQKVGISPLTLHRIETGKSSPSIVLLSEIAENLKKSIFSFIQDDNINFMHIKRKSQRTLSSSSLKIKLIGPRKMIANNIIVTYGDLKKGKAVDPHLNSGIEWTYVIDGKCIFKLGDQSFLIKAGDSLSYNARLEHSVIAQERLKFFNIYIEDGK
jgi:transcriptional regulator with XRE-family HTH domain